VAEPESGKGEDLDEVAEKGFGFGSVIGIRNGLLVVYCVMKGFDDGVTTFLGDSGFESSIVCFYSSG
jgi:hypothetical protein